MSLEANRLSPERASKLSSCATYSAQECQSLTSQTNTGSRATSLPKQSNTSTSPRDARDWRPTLFFDQTQSAPLLADILRAALWKVVLHADQFPDQSGLKDYLWIPAA